MLFGTLEIFGFQLDFLSGFKPPRVNSALGDVGHL